jgi:hypothetical protein
MKSHQLSICLALCLTLLAGCSSAPQKIETVSRIPTSASGAPLANFADSRTEVNRSSRELTEGSESHILLGDDAFTPPLAESISKLLRAELLDLTPKAVNLQKAYVGAVKITPGRTSSGNRGTPYIPPGTHPGAAALGILLGEGLIYLAESSKAGSAARESWSAELAIEIDGDPIYTYNRRLRSTDSNAIVILPELLQAAVKDVAEKYRLRIESLKATK